jgi:hypothetical protein
MGMFGRKSIKMGPVRFTASKSGTSASIGGKRGRVRVNSNGRRTVSANLGHGLRWTRSRKKLF